MKYIGNKERVGDFIRKVINDIELDEFESALDLFAGTGSVSKILSEKFSKVDSVDVLLLSKVLTHVKLNPTPNFSTEIIHNLEKQIKQGFITNNYSSKVGVNIFSEKVANHIDGALHKLQTLKDKISETEFLFLLNSIVEAADFRSNIMGSYESFYKKGWRKQAEKKWELNIYQNTNFVENTFFNQTVESFLSDNKTEYSIVYCDSPYNTRQYSSVFHVPETICQFHEVETKGVVNLPQNIFKSNFSKKKEVSKSFDFLINEVSKITKNFLISYSNEGILSVDQIQKKMKTKFTEVQVFEFEYRKFNTNRKNDKNTVNEIIIYGKK
jgi:adenine-specific DNA-methyltransferase